MLVVNYLGLPERGYLLFIRTIYWYWKLNFLKIQYIHYYEYFEANKIKFMTKIYLLESF